MDVPCVEVPDLVRRFLARGLCAQDTRALREHASGCGACAELYRHAVATVARVGRERRLEREAGERVLRRERRRRAMLDAHAPAPRRGARLRVLIYPAFLCVLMVQLTSPPARRQGLELAPLAGEVRVGGRLFASSGPLEQGQWCATSPGGRARLATEGASAVLDPDGLLLVERTAPLRLRLERGSLAVEGTLVVTSPHGVVELEGGRARVAIEAGTLRADCSEGDLRCLGPEGEQRLAPGGSLRLGARE